MVHLLVQAEGKGTVVSSVASVRNFITGRIDTESVGDDEDIFEAGLVSSMFVMELVLFVEQAFGVEVDGEDLEFDNFRSISAVANFADSRRAG